VSKERARRRAEREAEQARQAAVRAEREARMARRREVRDRLVAVLPRPVRVARQGGLIARRRRAQNAVVAVLFVLVQVLAWLLLSGWAARLGVLVLSLLLVPMLITVVFDRRS
jgi:Flp pilus assembly protein TadB